MALSPWRLVQTIITRICEELWEGDLLILELRRVDHFTCRNGGGKWGISIAEGSIHNPTAG